MESAHFTIAGFGFVVLHKMDGADFFVELSLREGFEEIASFIFENARFYDVNTLNFCIYYVHSDFEGGRLMAFNYSG